MPRLDCSGNGHDVLCGNEPQFNDIKITDASNNTITSAHPGDIVYIKAKIHGYNYPCSNFTLFFYGKDAEYLGCYKDRVGNGEDWWVAWPYGVPNYPGTTITCGALELLTETLRTTSLYIKYPCSHWTNPTDCTNEGCYWWNGSCHDAPPETCFEINNQIDCILHGCMWLLNKCWPLKDCEDYTSQTECEAAGCYWWNGSCHDAAPSSCEIINNQSDCTAYGCYWYDGSCHTNPPAGNAELIYFIVDPNPVPIGDSTTIETAGQNTGGSAGYFCIGIWTPQHGTNWSDWAWVEPGGYFSYNRTLSNVQYEQGCQAVIWWWDGTQSILLDEDWRTIRVSGNVDMYIRPQSIFYTGPFDPEAWVKIAHVEFENLGDVPDDAILAWYDLTDGPPGDVLGSAFITNIIPGNIYSHDIFNNVASCPITLWNVGVKLYGTQEPEPSFE